MTTTTRDVYKLAELPAEEVPKKLRHKYYFDFGAHPFEHASVVTEAKSVIDVLGRIGPYAQSWLSRRIEDQSRSDAVRVLTEKDFSNRGTGCFRALVVEGARFDPSYFVGVEAGEAVGTLFLDRGARWLGSIAYLNEGDIFIGSETLVEPGVGIKGPTIVMTGNELRQGTYLRGNVVLGSNSGGNAYRGELKNVVMMNDANFPHPSYSG